MTTSNLSDTTMRTGIIVLLAGATTVAAAALGCATPYPATAAVAALHLRARDGIALIMLSWLASHTIGFGLKGYPLDADTLCLAAAIGGSALVGLFAATMLLRHTPVSNPVLRAGVALIAAFAAFKGAVLAPSLLLADGAHGFTVDVLARQAVRNVLFLAGLLMLHRLALTVAAGLPAARKAAV
jgi:hypothetical protein